MRIRSSALNGVAALFALAIGGLAYPGVAGAVTYVQTSDHCSGAAGCGIVAGNTIDVTQAGGLTTITVSLAPNWAFVSTGTSGSGGSLTFGFASPLVGALVTNTSGNGWSSTDGQFSVLNGTVTNPSTVSTSLLQAPAANGNTFSFTNGMAIDCNSSGGSSQCSTPSGPDLSFTINTAVALAADTTGGFFFWADVINNNRAGGPTGLIDFSLSQVPLPGALPLFATGLAGLVLLGRRKKKQAAASAA